MAQSKPEIRVVRDTAMLWWRLRFFFARLCEAVRVQFHRPRVDFFDPDYMTDLELSHFWHGRCGLIDWDLVRHRRRTGDKQAPWLKADASKGGAA